MLACVMGGYNVKERLRCIEELKAFDCSGYVIDGFHSNGVSAAKLNWEEVEPVLTETLVFFSCLIITSSVIKILLISQNL